MATASLSVTRMYSARCAISWRKVAASPLTSERVALMLAVVGVASELDPKIGGDDVGVRILRGGMSACQALISTDKWDSTQAVAIERALEEAEALNKRVHPKYIAQANAMQTQILDEVTK